MNMMKNKVGPQIFKKKIQLLCLTVKRCKFVCHYQQKLATTCQFFSHKLCMPGQEVFKERLGAFAKLPVTCVWASHELGGARRGYVPPFFYRQTKNTGKVVTAMSDLFSF